MRYGTVYSGAPSAQLRDFLTWHDLDRRRVWLHTRREQGNSRWLISMAVEIHNQELQPVSDVEKKLRLKLAAVQEYQGVDELSSTSFREIALGELMRIHSDSIFEILSKQEKSKGNRVKLALEVRSNSSKGSRTFRFDSISEIQNLGANSKDALLIAKVYSQISLSGAKYVAKKTAEALNVDVELIHMAVRVARRNKWLTSNGAGKAGGQLTTAGEKEFNKSKGPERMAALLNSDWIYTN